MSLGKSKRKELQTAVVFSLTLAGTIFLFVMVAKNFILGPG